RRGRIRRHLRAHHPRGHSRGSRRRDPRRAQRRRRTGHPAGRQSFLGRRPHLARGALGRPGADLRASRRLDRGGTGLLGPRPRAASRRGAEARRVPRGLRESMIPSLLVLVVGLGLAGVAAAIGVAAAAVSQVELTRWVHYKLRGTEAAVRLLEHPGRVLATANALTTMGVVIAAAAVPALLAETTPTFLGVFTVTVIIPLFVSAAYLVPRVLGRRWAEPIVARALPWTERAG